MSRSEVLVRQHIEQQTRDFVGGVLRGWKGEASEATVEWLAKVETGFSFGGGREDRPEVIRRSEALEHAAIEESREGRVKKDDESARSLLEQKTIGELLGGASTQSEYGCGAGESVAQCGGFKTTKASFALAFEELRDGGMAASFEVGVQIEEVPAEGVGKDAADGRFAGTHKTSENDAAEVSRKSDGGCDDLLFGTDWSQFVLIHTALSSTLLNWRIQNESRDLGGRGSVEGGECSFSSARDAHRSYLSRRGPPIATEAINCARQSRMRDHSQAEYTGLSVDASALVPHDQSWF